MWRRSRGRRRIPPGSRARHEFDTRGHLQGRLGLVRDEVTGVVAEGRSHRDRFAASDRGLGIGLDLDRPDVRGLERRQWRRRRDRERFGLGADDRRCRLHLVGDLLRTARRSSDLLDRVIRIDGVRSAAVTRDRPAEDLGSVGQVLAEVEVRLGVLDRLRPGVRETDEEAAHLESERRLGAGGDGRSVEGRLPPPDLAELIVAAFGERGRQVEFAPADLGLPARLGRRPPVQARSSSHPNRARC